MKTLVRALLPQAWRYAIRGWIGDFTRFSGPYADWIEASADGFGYNDKVILNRVKQATRQVIEGKASYEQDSVLFHSPLPPSSLLKVLRAAAKRNPAGLNVLDFGGALGSLYHRVLPYLSNIKINSWYVCEQPHFVECGQREFQVASLRFIENPAAASESKSIDVLLLSSVLCYLPRPLEQLRLLAELSPGAILIDRTPWSPDNAWHLLVQHVPRSIYRAAYPVWLIPRSSILPIFRDYILVEEFEVDEEPVSCGHLRARYAGMIWNSCST